MLDEKPRSVTTAMLATEFKRHMEDYYEATIETGNALKKLEHTQSKFADQLVETREDFSKKFDDAHTAFEGWKGDINKTAWKVIMSFGGILMAAILSGMAQAYFSSGHH